MKKEEKNELEGVMPKKFYLTIGGKEREVKFGNLALAKVEQKYGSLQNFDNLTKDLTEKPMQTIPWLLSICLKDKEGLNFDDVDSFLESMDDENISVKTVMDVINPAMSSSMSNMFGAGKK